MLKGFKILTVTHKHTKLQDLGKYLFAENQGQELLDGLENLKKRMKLEELMYLATCNRVLYFFYAENTVDDKFILDFFRTVNPDIKEEDVFGSELSSHSFYEGEAAIFHLFKVTASIDSMVVGEREILRQIREAYQQALQWGITNDNIRLAMDFAVRSAKSIYANTRIGEKPVSVVSLAMQKMLAAELPDSAKILLVGAGQTNTLVAKFLKSYGYTNVLVFNRSIERSLKLVDTVEIGEAKILSDLPFYQAGFDCMIVCTAATEPVITNELYQKLIREDTSQKILIDLSIPHNVSEEVVSKNNTQYIEIEGLRVLANENLSFRRQEVVKATEFIQAEVKAFHPLYKQRKLERALKHIPKEIKAIKAHAMNEVFKKELDILDEESRALLERMMVYMEKRCIGIPMKAAKEAML